ncbi:hypothetical protein RFI_24123 [Reticulomyxa filosa]|uniref:Uncharacterized protein n=1 Tax=Reticulomyxa filosa TaxID=46433 RepID=X6MII2_RETFI|nr:hypothetical protein RFI_24123 [Reticulomyxa filosa]|eukprot:ETO13252.1 hypothetical protein RFI_24123 [Reticulomyxa filosa]
MSPYLRFFSITAVILFTGLFPLFIVVNFMNSKGRMTSKTVYFLKYHVETYVYFCAVLSMEYFFIVRLQDALKQTAYAYSSFLYRALYALVIVYVAMLIILSTVLPLITSEAWVMAFISVGFVSFISIFITLLYCNLIIEQKIINGHFDMCSDVHISGLQQGDISQVRGTHGSQLSVEASLKRIKKMEKTVTKMTVLTMVSAIIGTIDGVMFGIALSKHRHVHTTIYFLSNLASVVDAVANICCIFLSFAKYDDLYHRMCCACHFLCDHTLVELGRKSHYQPIRDEEEEEDEEVREDENDEDDMTTSI